jgi:hypothetical protein
MNERLHELRAEIKTIDEMLESLSSPMHELALEEQRNLQFELEMLERNKPKDLHNPQSITLSLQRPPHPFYLIEFPSLYAPH